MLLREGINFLATRRGTTKTELTERVRLGQLFNLAYREVADAHLWQLLRRSGSLTLVPLYDTGTITMTNGNNTITFSGSSLVADMKGRYIRKKSGDNWYRIVDLNTSTSTAVLDQEVVEADGSYQFEMWKRFYFPYSEARMVLGMDDVDGIPDLLATPNIAGIMSPDLPKRVQNRVRSNRDYFAFGMSQYITEYSTGTITFTKNSDIVTAAGSPLWLANVGPGDLLVSSGQEYRVKRVEGNEKIVLWNKALVDGVGKTYTVVKDAPFGLQFNFVSDSKVVLPYTYQARVFDLVNEDKDRTILPQDFDLAILDRALAGSQRDANKKEKVWTTTLSIAEARLAGLKRRYRLVKNPSMRFPPLVPQGMGRGR